MNEDGNRGKVFAGVLTVARSINTLVVDTVSNLLFISQSSAAVSYQQVGNVEAREEADPGSGAAIPVLYSGHVPLTVGAGAETNTLADPTFVGQKLLIFCDANGGGTRAITAASDINVTGNNIVTFNATGEMIELTGITDGGALVWSVTAIDTAVLS